MTVRLAFHSFSNQCPFKMSKTSTKNLLLNPEKNDSEASKLIFSSGCFFRNRRENGIGETSGKWVYLSVGLEGKPAKKVIKLFFLYGYSESDDLHF